MSDGTYEIYEVLPVGKDGLSDLLIVTMQTHPQQVTAEAYLVPSAKAGGQYAYTQLQGHMWGADEPTWLSLVVRERARQQIREARAEELAQTPTEVTLQPLTNDERIRALAYLGHYEGLRTVGRNIRSPELRERLANMLTWPELELRQLWPRAQG